MNGKTCKKCGHECHCNKSDCEKCANDVCTECDCDEEEKK